MGTPTKEYINVRASEILHQEELLELIKSRFPESVKPIGRLTMKGAQTFEVRVPLDSLNLEDIRNLIVTRRKEGVHGFADYTIGRYFRKYTVAELRSAEILRLNITPHFEPAGEECGTIYETLCPHCNLGRQMSDLVLDLRRVPQHKDVAETIAWVEWVVSSRFVQAFAENHLTGAEFLPVLEFKNPGKRSQEWHQLRVTGKAGWLAEKTLLGRDPFSPSEVSWRCPLGHTVAAQILSEVYLNKEAWDGSDIAVTSSLFGQGRNLLRPTPLIIISQRLYRALEKAGLKGYSVGVAHLV